MFFVTRSTHNPILGPDHMTSFEAHAAFNGCPIKIGSTIHMLYRAQSELENYQGSSFSLSSIGKAVSRDGVHFTHREQFITPEEIWERYGCEDPRVTKIDGKYFIFYTALSTYPFGGDGIKVGLAISRDLKTIDEKHLVTPFNAKAMTLFPEKINGKYVALLSVNTDQPPSSIAVAEFNKIEDVWSEVYWKKWYAELDKHILEIPKRSGEHVEVGAPPIKTKEGWLLVYSHIQKYFENNKIFGIEAVLMDLKKPRKLIGKTRGPLLIPEESYEKFGQVMNTIFPSGALVEKNILSIYYGTTDTTCAVAHVPLPELLHSMKFPHKETDFARLSKKPIMVPLAHSTDPKNWESRAVFNPAAIQIGNITYIVYRAMSDDNTSVMGLALTTDGVTLTKRLTMPIYTPREVFEEKKIPGGNSGCEDPRVVQIKDKIYMYYTAYNGVNLPSIAMTSISEKDFIAQQWNWTKPVIVSRDGVDDKDGCIHPEKINGKYFLYHRVNHMICGDYGATPAFTERNNFKDIPIMHPRPGMWDSRKVGVSAPPLKTKEGWLLLYHGISDDGIYRVGAALLSLKDPTRVLSRSTDHVFEPRENYELNGQVGRVVFPCGAVVKKDTIFMYYGGADSVINVASCSMKKILASLKPVK